MTDHTPLSPAAKVVLDAASDVYWDWTDMEPAASNVIAAAALRAAADQVVPEPDDAAKEAFSIAALRHRWQIRDQFLAIAAELEGE